MPEGGGRPASTLGSEVSTSRIDRIVLGSADLRDDAATPRLLDRFRERGGGALDLANVYADGESQRALGRWLRSTGAEMTLYAKGCHPPYCSPALVSAEVDKARSDVGVDQLDVFMLHRDETEVPAAAWADALLEQVHRGAIGAFGVSNWTVERLVELRGALGDDAGRLAVFSNHFSLGEMVTPTWPGTLGMSLRDIEALDALGVVPIAWASLAAGYFAHRESPSWDSDDNEARRARAEELAAERGTTATTVALAYVLNQPVRVLAAIGTRTVEHIDQLLAASELDLSPRELEWLVSDTAASTERARPAR
jgi:aryl-alcohol dehydrogenase-like predicted oxidoreductase